MNLHQEFVKLGNNRRKLTNELLALLPDIFEKQIYKKYAATIVEYAGKFGGLGAEVVKKRLRLEKYVKDKPKLRELIVTEGVHKVALVASLATVENQNVWANKVKNMSKVALQELSKEVRTGECVCKAVPVKISLELDEEMSGMFLKLKKKFGGNLTHKEVMKKILEMVAQSEKVIPGDNFKGKIIERKSYQLKNLKPVTRYIPAQIKKQIIQNSHNQCSYPNCNKPAEIFHHKERFANNKSHESVIYLCKIHHEFAHNGLVQNEKRPAQEWRLQFQIDEVDEIDQLYREYRKAWQQ